MKVEKEVDMTVEEEVGMTVEVEVEMTVKGEGWRRWSRRKGELSVKEEEGLSIK